MENITAKDMEEALQAISSMINRSEKAQQKFAQGTSQHTLQKNRLNALNIALSLIKRETEKGVDIEPYTKKDLESAIAPIASLISKSEKAQAKLKQGTWQHRMLRNNLKALYVASPLITKALEER